MKRVVGVDEAGRGPVIGPMVIAGVAVLEGRVAELLETGVKDSKKLSPKRREDLLGPIMGIVEGHHVEVVAAEFIDSARPRKNLNQIEAAYMARILDTLCPDIAQIGSADVKPMRFKEMILSEMKSSMQMEIISTHHAEDQFPAVAAASIVAKTTRDRLVKELHKEYGDFGSGYPSDPRTRAYIREMLARKTLPRIVRRSWKTIQFLEDKPKDELTTYGGGFSNSNCSD